MQETWRMQSGAKAVKIQEVSLLFTATWEPIIKLLKVTFQIYVKDKTKNLSFSLLLTDLKAVKTYFLSQPT